MHDFLHVCDIHSYYKLQDVTLLYLRFVCYFELEEMLKYLGPLIKTIPVVYILCTFVHLVKFLEIRFRISTSLTENVALIR